MYIGTPHIFSNLIKPVSTKLKSLLVIILMNCFVGFFRVFDSSTYTSVTRESFICAKAVYASKWKNIKVGKIN